ncbi:MAG TPA: 30S ribosomal protein S7 [Chloroflexi bacterium]|nr:30S ribosomal protein S7 [Chloroflexota bacterium]
MPRRYRPPKRKVAPDPRYNNVHVAMFINRIMKGGKKSLARRLMYEALDIVQQRTKRDPVEVFEEALKNVTPMIEVKPRRVGGSTYQVPVEVDAHRGRSLAMRWLLAAARARGGRGFSEKLAAELMDAARGEGAAVKKKNDTHRMAEANRTFAHYRW